MPKIEDVKWGPPGTVISESVMLLRSIRPGNTKRIYHEDISCTKKGTVYRCNLVNALSSLRKKGWIVHSYHEDVHVIVVRRIA